nr:Bcr/CflA family multidrug efflux MFS transporter [uncultured Desulfuromonas sp.]
MNQTHVQPRWHVLLVLSLLMGFASISTDLYLPAIPAMAESLGANAGMMEFTISGYLIGFSLGQLVWGPVSDAHGRRPAIAIGLVMFMIGSAGCALSDNAMTIIGWRVVQALGACASVALSRAMVRDLYQGNYAAQMLSTLITIMAIAPLIGPLVGGQIIGLAGWRAIFWVLVLVGAITFVALFSIPETHPKERRNQEHIIYAMSRYWHLLQHKRLLGYLCVGGFYYAGMFAYVAGTPFVYISYYQVAPQSYGWLFALGIIGIMISNQINARLVRKVGYDRLLLYGTLLATLFSLFTALACQTGWGGLWGLVVPLVLFVSATGLIVANAITGALADFPQRSGAISALTGAFQYGSGILGSGLVGVFANETPQPMGWVIGISGIGCLVSMVLIRKTHGTTE